MTTHANNPDPKRLRTLFIDDNVVPAVAELKRQGYDVEQIMDVDSLDELCNGKYQIIFIDVRGVGEKLGTSGLDILKFVAEHNPLVFRVVYSAKPFQPTETEFLVKFADRSVKKDLTIVEFIDVIDEYAKSISEKSVLASVEKHLNLSWWQMRKLRRKHDLSAWDVQKIANATGTAADAAKIVQNVVAVSKVLLAMTAS
jgi:hypothetical protein